MAGNVIVSQDVNGNLNLTGDAAANALEINAGAQAGVYVINGKIDAATNTQTLINGVPQVTLTNITGKIIANMGQGNDELTILGGTNQAGLPERRRRKRHYSRRTVPVCTESSCGNEHHTLWHSRNRWRQW